MSSIRMSREQMMDLVSRRYHSTHVNRHRGQLVIGRVQLVSAIFAVLTPLWISIDAWAYPWPTWGILAVLRLASCLAFVALAWPRAPSLDPCRTGRRMLLIMLSMPIVFYVASLILLDSKEFGALGNAVTLGYGLLPFIVVAGLSVFPLTAVEVLIVGLPMMAAIAGGTLHLSGGDAYGLIAPLWLMFLVLGVSAVSGMSQLHYMIALVNRAIHDPLTEAFTRRSGAETLDLQFRVSVMQEQPLGVAFLDVDNFKSVNDQFGHEAGDAVLRNTAEHLKQNLRRGDTLVRWGGEEFLVVLPNTDAAGAKLVAQRIRESGLGERPDGAPVTASMGMAERVADNQEDWPKLVDLADRRMYQAKNSGKDRCISCAEEVII
ncbi:diguanylate cyclase [Magnetospira sp. QH-2]|uniref:GGDEF domain-containing protein n=1 Tax=Magnetospira sp. (strain QH-2) TaxID=1288970 RepID=UPI00130EA86E|nr:GGDEF domain-containing protein [Magnetospira sp. QH-2]